MLFNNLAKSDLAPQHGDRIDIVFYTDPLCCWSWAIEPHWRRFKEAYADHITWKICMGGMIPNWQTFNDPFNAISRPVQMGALWMHAHETTGVPFNGSIWVDDPPASSYPACLAVKCAELQSPEIGEAFLSVLRGAVISDAKNIAKTEVLLELAFALGRQQPGLMDYARFSRDLNGPQCRQALKQDLERVRYHRIGRFPTLTMTRNGRGLMMTGFRPFEALEEAFRQIALGAREVEAG